VRESDVCNVIPDVTIDESQICIVCHRFGRAVLKCNNVKARRKANVFMKIGTALFIENNFLNYPGQTLISPFGCVNSNICVRNEEFSLNSG
jgi:hypothetical protein